MWFSAVLNWGAAAFNLGICLFDPKHMILNWIFVGVNSVVGAVCTGIVLED